MTNNSKVKLNEVVERLYMAPLVKKEEGGSFKILNPSAVKNGEIIESKFAEGNSNSQRDISQMLLKKGDVIFQSKGNRFEAIYVDKDYDNLVASQVYFTLKLDSKKILAKYLTWFLNSEVAADYFEMNSSGSVINVMSRKVLGDLEINLPSIEDQQVVVDLLESFSEEREITNEYLRTKAELIDEKIFLKIEG